MIIGEWQVNQTNLITFVMVDASYTEVAGLGNTFTLSISKNGGPFLPSAGVKAEISNGWYSYLSTVAEANTYGPVSIRVTGVGCIQQNLEYVVETRVSGCVDFTYTVLHSITLLPLPGVFVWVALDAAPAAVIWHGLTDVAGVARDVDGDLPCLMAATYRFFKSLIGYADSNAPYDTEIVT